MKKLSLVIAMAACVSTSALAIDMQVASQKVSESQLLIETSLLSQEEAPAYFDMVSAQLAASDDKDAFIAALFKNNASQANVVYAIAKANGYDDDYLIAKALSEGVDPAVMLEPTAFALILPPPPPPPPPGGGTGGGDIPPPPPPSTGGGSGSGGVSVSGN